MNRRSAATRARPALVRVRDFAYRHDLRIGAELSVIAIGGILLDIEFLYQRDPYIQLHRHVLRQPDFVIHARLPGDGTGAFVEAVLPDRMKSYRCAGCRASSTPRRSCRSRRGSRNLSKKPASFRCGRYPPPVPFALHFLPLRPPSASPVETSAKRLGALGCLSLGFQERSLRLSLQATFFGAVGIIATEVALHWRPAPAGWRAAVAGYLISLGITAPLGSARPNIKRCLC
jgi:hypothetical protein